VRSLGEAVRRPLRHPTPSPAIPRQRPALATPWLRLVILALLVKLAVIGITLVEFGWRPDPFSVVGSAWAQWDAQHYIALATHGYQATGDAGNLIAFLPLFPTLIHLLSLAGVPPMFGALLISNIAGVIAAILLYEIARGEGDEPAAFRADLRCSRSSPPPTSCWSATPSRSSAPSPSVRCCWRGASDGWRPAP